MQVPYFLRADWRGETLEETQERRGARAAYRRAMFRGFAITAAITTALRLIDVYLVS